MDDEPCIRTVAQKVVEELGYEAIVAEDGVSALALYAQQPGEIDLILTDLVMPLMDGLMLIRAVRKLNPDQKIIRSTGRVEDMESQEIRSLGVDACLMKPHSRTSCFSRLRKLSAVKEPSRPNDRRRRNDGRHRGVVLIRRSAARPRAS